MTNTTNSLLLAPFSQEAEEAVIGSILTSPDVYKTCSAFLKGEDFYLTRHRMIWSAVGRLWARQDLVDLVTVSVELTNMGVLEEIGGYAYLIHLINNTPNSMHAEAYAHLVERTATRRKLLVAADKIRDLAMDEKTEITDILRQAQKGVLDCSGPYIMHRGGVIGDLVEEHAAEFERRLIQRVAGVGLPTRFVDADALLRGLEMERLYTLAGRPGMGKTSWILSMILAMAQAGVGIVLHTMEMSADQVMHRLIALLSGISTHRQKDPSKLEPHEPGLILKAYGDLSDLPIYIEDAPSPNYLDVQSKSEWVVRTLGYKLVVVDGIYRMSATFDTRGNDTAVYTEAVTGLKNMARTLKLPVLATHQLNRDLESRPDKRPMLSDLRQCGRIEEESDVVMFVYRDCVYNNTTDPRLAELIVAKHRDGPTGRVYMGFDAPTTRFYDIEQPGGKRGTAI